MGRITNALKAAINEKQLGASWGRWALLVSQALDSLGSLVLGPAQLLEISLGANQPGVTTGTDIIFGNVTVAGGIPYNSTTGVAVLTGGRTYRLSARGAAVNFAGGTDEIDLEWVDAASNTPLQAGYAGLWKPVSNTLNVAPSPQTEIVYTPATDQAVKLRCTGSSGTATLLGNVFTASIIELR